MLALKFVPDRPSWHLFPKVPKRLPDSGPYPGDAKFKKA
jgi:hypothetical protein